MRSGFLIFLLKLSPSFILHIYYIKNSTKSQIVNGLNFWKTSKFARRTFYDILWPICPFPLCDRNFVVFCHSLRNSCSLSYSENTPRHRAAMSSHSGRRPLSPYTFYLYVYLHRPSANTYKSNRWILIPPIGDHTVTRHYPSAIIYTTIRGRSGLIGCSTLLNLIVYLYVWRSRT